jgi:sialic acid synthase SpsE
MEKSKMCVAIDWKAGDDLNNLKIVKNLIESFDNTHVDYVSINLYKSSMVNTKMCDELDDFCRARNISWFPLVTSIQAINLTRPYYSKLPTGKSGYMVGIPSSHIKDFKLMEYAKECSDYLVLYTGACTQKEIDRAIETAQPDLVIHHSQGEVRLDYLKYLQGISIEFDKRYITGFKNNYFDSTSLLLAAHMLDTKFLEFTIEITDDVTEYYLDRPGVFNEYTQLVNDLDQIDNSRGGYEARKLSKKEKELNKL